MMTAEQLASKIAEKIHYEFSVEWWHTCALHKEEHRHDFQRAESKRREIAAEILPLIREFQSSHPKEPMSEAGPGDYGTGNYASWETDRKS